MSGLKSWKMRRQLSDSEKSICMKMVIKFEKELQHLKFLERYHDMMIGEGCYWNYLERLKENKDLKRKFVGDIQEIEFKIRTLKEQIELGVEEKEEEKKEEIGGYFG